MRPPDILRLASRKLRPDEVDAVARAAQAGDAQAAEQAIRETLCLAWRAVKPLVGGNDPDDVLQEALIGIAKAIRDYQPRSRFSSYAHIKARGAARDLLRRAARNRPAEEPRPIAMDGMPALIPARKPALRPEDIPVVESHDERIDGANVHQEKIRRLLSNLNAREREIIKARFGLDERHEETLEEIGDRIGLTKQRVQQVEVEVLERLGRET